MIARSQLAVLDHNDGVATSQAVTKQGALRYKQVFSKVTQNWCVKKITKKKSCEYQNELLETTIKFKETPEIDSMPVLQVSELCQCLEISQTKNLVLGMQMGPFVLQNQNGISGNLEDQPSLAEQDLGQLLINLFPTLNSTNKNTCMR